VTAFLLATAKNVNNKMDAKQKMHLKVDTKIGYFFEANDGPFFIRNLIATKQKQSKNVIINDT